MTEPKWRHGETIARLTSAKERREVVDRLLAETTDEELRLSIALAADYERSLSLAPMVAARKMNENADQIVRGLAVLRAAEAKAAREKK